MLLFRSRLISSKTTDSTLLFGKAGLLGFHLFIRSKVFFSSLLDNLEDGTQRIEETCMLIKVIKGRIEHESSKREKRERRASQMVVNGYP